MKQVARRPPKFREAELIDMLVRQIASFGLDLSDLTVVLGAGTGYQSIAATAAALSGARRVVAFAREPRRSLHFGTAAASTMALADYAGVARTVEIKERMDRQEWLAVDVVVNCRQVGPITRPLIYLLPRHAVVALMAEAWELGFGLVDFEACCDAGIKIAAPNLKHPAIMLLPEMGLLCCLLLDDAGLQQQGSRIAILSNTPCSSFIEGALRERGSRVSVFPHPALLTQGPWDAIVVALQSSDKPAMDINHLGQIADRGRHTLIVQFSGEIDRRAASYFGLKVWPPTRPPRGQLGLSLDMLGPSPAIRRLVGGLKAGEDAFRGASTSESSIGYVVDGNTGRGPKSGAALAGRVPTAVWPERHSH